MADLLAHALEDAIEMVATGYPGATFVVLHADGLIRTVEVRLLPHHSTCSDEGCDRE